ncbi:MAG: hypothetical protein ACXWUE_07885 [Polyangiales bacterium]
MGLPPMAWVILALGLLWLALRLMSRKAEEKRAEAREQRMAELMAERERPLGKHDDAPQSLAAVVSDSTPPKAPAEKQCLGCKTMNPPDATTCSGCGLEL